MKTFMVSGTTLRDPKIAATQHATFTYPIGDSSHGKAGTVWRFVVTEIPGSGTVVVTHRESGFRVCAVNPHHIASFGYAEAGKRVLADLCNRTGCARVSMVLRSVMPMHDRPLAEALFHSYRCKTQYGWVHAGAMTHSMAWDEILRSTDSAKRSDLEIFDHASDCYVPVPLNVAPQLPTPQETPTAEIRRATFIGHLAGEYARLFTTEEYAYVASRTTPMDLAVKMTNGLLNGTANKDGEGIKNTCKMLGIKHTYTAIRAYLQPTENK